MTVINPLCKKCGKEKTRTEKTSKGGIFYRCRPCWADYMREFNKRPGVLEKKKARERAWRLLKPTARRDYELRRGFGLSLAEYERMSAAQGGVCAICKGPQTHRGKSLAVDHCHTTGAVRGLLCGTCNNGLGMAKDDPTLLRKMADYLEESRRPKLVVAA